MDLLTAIILAVIGLVTSVYLYFKKKFSYWRERGVVHIKPSFPFGNLSLKQHFTEFTVDIYKRKGEASFVGIYFLTKPIVVPVGLDLIQNILVKDFSSFHARGMYVNEVDDPLSAHMFSLDGERWKFIRTKLSPTFTSGKMKYMFPTIVAVAERFVATLDDIVDRESELEMNDFLGRFTTDVIGSCAFGIECNSMNNPNSAFRQYGKKFLDEPSLALIRNILITLSPDLARKLHIRALRKDVTDFFLDTVRKTVAYRKENDIQRNDFMDLLIQMNTDTNEDGKLTLEQIAAQASLFFFAGFETSSSVMTFCLYELALNQNIQEKVRQEITQIMASHNGELTYEGMQQMTYLEMTINETLRKYPSVPFLMRSTVRDYSVPDTNMVIEKGTLLFVPVHSIHHDPEIYPNPELFDPERMSPEQIKGRHPMSFLAFGDGPRNCIGMRFGKMQTKIGLIALLKNYHFATCSKTPNRIIFDPKKGILTSKDGMVLDVTKI
ncbi:probable cytochrome P450 6a14 [Hermetia illucens]|uniref:probable cytochrome P450 6a14 n=1 Tax=Hermetia illucens TaxID=343691 RepID=UPI0018CC2568|nr:probable cytochrome P450 6a14 [Hermetia illucens]